MANDSFKIKNSINIAASSGSTSEAGDLRRRAADDELAYNDGAQEVVVVTSDNISTYETGGTPAASAVTVTPAGTIASTDVQAALEELDGDIQAISATGSASDISFTPAGDIAATDVQAAIEELDSEKEPSLPLTTRGDVLYRDASNATARLPVGTNGQVLTSDGTDVSWEDASGGFSDPLTTDGDIIVRDSGTTTRLGIGTNGQVLSVTSGAPAWEDAAAATFTVRSGSGTITVVDTDNVIVADGTSGTAIVNLPPAGDVSGRAFTVKRADSTSNIVQVNADGAELIDGSPSFNIDTESQSVTVLSDGSNWIKLNSFDRTERFQSYTPSFTGLGTVSNASGTYRRVAGGLEIYAFCTTGAVTGTTVSISLPSGETIDSGALPQPTATTASGTAQVVGEYTDNFAGTQRGGPVIAAPGTSTTLLYFGGAINSNGRKLEAQGGTGITSNSVGFSLRVTVPIV